MKSVARPIGHGLYMGGLVDLTGWPMIRAMCYPVLKSAR